MTDMFYGWQQWEPTGNPNNVLANDNPPFASHSYSKPPWMGSLRRGYMRSALPEKYGNTRLHFQFNPNTIVRSTTVNQDLLGVANWTPEDWQAASLAGGGASFSFSLLFDRQDEVAHHNYRNSGDLAGNVDMTLGVEVDIRALDKVAGIGQVTAAVDASAGAPSGSLQDLFGFGGGGGASASTTGNVTAASDGNQAFMASAQPVRAVFSKNFIVEGFLNQVDITYTKFSQNMVPVMATVQCSMQAFYIGAARATTWWSQAVADGTLTNAVAKSNGSTSPSNTPLTDLFGFGGNGGGASGPQSFSDVVNGSIAQQQALSNPQGYGNNRPVNTSSNSSVVVNLGGGRGVR